ncbi:hypothetical protein POM88_002465 [Heracleum sosnowskyi]|uniref:Uncharacterized protein n=1 Tax=Heracleum sosnowskyi TaxID=360622 RepID=A0AAD8JE18_9APIA|nr:hypothetical protein POM88_002465 [Heracleum sosnowskyi]
MNHCVATCEDVRSSVTVSIGISENMNPMCAYDVEQTYSSCLVAPFFCGSLFSVSKSLMQDAHFGDEKVTALSPRSIPILSGMSSSPSSSARKGACGRANIGNKLVVRVDGFHCLDRDRRNCSIPAMV